MKHSTIRKLTAMLACAMFAAGGASVVFAQNNAAAADPGAAATQPGNAGQPTHAAPATGASLTKAQRKAANKQARKEARARRDAELKKLEDAGYSPSRNDPNYPTDLQNAQKKAGIGQ
jgi:Spy/CpxP family protein refolding chaperone